MGSTKRRYPKEEIIKRGNEIFEADVKTQVKDRDPMDFVVIDIETRDFEIDADNLAACLRLRTRNPEAQVFARRVASRTVHHFGGRIRPRAK